MARERIHLDDPRQLLIMRVLFAGAPAVYLIVIYLMSRNAVPSGTPQPLVTYILLALALLALSTIPLVTSVVLSFLKRSGSSGTARDRASTLCIIRLSLAEACFVLGVGAYFITFDHKLLYYFYPIGIVALIIVWPTRERFDALVAQLEET